MKLIDPLAYHTLKEGQQVKIVWRGPPWDQSESCGALLYAYARPHPKDSYGYIEHWEKRPGRVGIATSEGSTHFTVAFDIYA